VVSELNYYARSRVSPSVDLQLRTARNIAGIIGQRDRSFAGAAAILASRFPRFSCGPARAWCHNSRPGRILINRPLDNGKAFGRQATIDAGMTRSRNRHVRIGPVRDGGASYGGHWVSAAERCHFASIGTGPSNSARMSLHLWFPSPNARRRAQLAIIPGFTVPWSRQGVDRPPCKTWALQPAQSSNSEKVRIEFKAPGWRSSTAFASIPPVFFFRMLRIGQVRRP